MCHEQSNKVSNEWKFLGGGGGRKPLNWQKLAKSSKICINNSQCILFNY